MLKKVIVVVVQSPDRDLTQPYVFDREEMNPQEAVEFVRKSFVGDSKIVDWDHSLLRIGDSIFPFSVHEVLSYFKENSNV